MQELYLLHGRTRLEEDMEDWGFNGPRLQGVDGIHVTYGNINVHFAGDAYLLAAQQLTGWDRFGDTALTVRMAEDCVEVRGFNGHDNDNTPLTDATVYFGDWGLMKQESDQASLIKAAQPAPRPTPQASGDIDYVKTAQSYGLVIVPWAEFLAKTDLPDGLMARALEVQKTVNGSQVLYDPDDDAEGFKLIGDDPVALAKGWEEHSLIENIVYTYRT
ncbi:hypothetical protein IC232_04240 [Microvirga sp. BT688]|uniref:hypothetical protein n=1 Tax=Microvirga sp. TaxID=1873136 RepID=UPI00168796C0|nr:hypothetical protein [Microvirga sp.]MBD2745903.1 hypothetical protein [Microvirga sp.]